MFHYLYSGMLKRSESNPFILKQNFQELQSRFSDYQHVFTDGSKDGDKVALRKLAYSNILEISSPKELKIFPIKILIVAFF